MTTPDDTTQRVLNTLAALEARIAAGEQPAPAPVPVVRAPGFATLIFGVGDLSLEEQAAMQRRWLARHAMPVELRKEWE